MKEITDISDLKEVLALQKIAFLGEAIKNNDMRIPPMTQTPESIEADFRNGMKFYKRTAEGRIIASVRVLVDAEKTCHIKRLIVLPEHQHHGIGTGMIKSVEKLYSHCPVFKIFTGEKSADVIRLYHRLGYRTEKIEKKHNHSLVHLKKLNPPRA